MATYYWVGGSGTWDTTTKTNWATSSGGAGGFGPPTGTDNVNIDGNSGTGTITTAANATAQAVTLNSANMTLLLGADLTITNQFTFTAGTLSLQSYAFKCLFFQSNNSNARSIAFGTGSISVSGNNTAIFEMSTATNFTYTGTPTVNFTYAGATGSRSFRFGSIAGATESNVLNVNVTAGTDTFTWVAGSSMKSLNYSGFSGASFPGAGLTLYGGLTLSATMTPTASASAVTFAATSGTQQITANGKTMDCPITINGNGGTFAFQDALTQGSTRAFTITNGTVQLKAGVTTTVGALATSGTNQKVLQSTSAGSQATLSQASGSFNAQYLTVKDIAATGGAKFNALNNCVTQGNNSGWYFAPQLGRPLPAFAF